MTFADLSSIVSLPESSLFAEILDNRLPLFVLKKNPQLWELTVSEIITQLKERCSCMHNNKTNIICYYL